MSPGSGKTERRHRRLGRAVDRALELASGAETFAARAPDISGWSVGRHLEHLLRSDRQILAWVEGVAAGASGLGGSGRPGWRGWIVLLTGYIPRGKGRAPEFTRPEGMPREEVEAGFRDLAVRVRRIGFCLGTVARSRARLPHPSLGAFDASQWLRFAELHHRHHEKVIRDILGARPG